MGRNRYFPPRIFIPLKNPAAALYISEAENSASQLDRLRFCLQFCLLADPYGSLLLFLSGYRNDLLPFTDIEDALTQASAALTAAAVSRNTSWRIQFEKITRPPFKYLSKAERSRWWTDLDWFFPTLDRQLEREHSSGKNKFPSNSFRSNSSTDGSHLPPSPSLTPRPIPTTLCNNNTRRSSATQARGSSYSFLDHRCVSWALNYRAGLILLWYTYGGQSEIYLTQLRRPVENVRVAAQPIESYTCFCQLSFNGKARRERGEVKPDTPESGQE